MNFDKNNSITYMLFVCEFKNIILLSSSQRIELT